MVYSVQYIMTADIAVIVVLYIYIYIYILYEGVAVHYVVFFGLALTL